MAMYVQESTADAKKKALSVRTTWLDKAILWVAPQRAFKRIAARVAIKRLSHVFDGAKVDRIHGNNWLTSRLSPDSMADADLETLRLRCEDLYRNDMVAHSAVESRVTNEVGSGIKPQARVRAEGSVSEDQASEINRRLEETARRWSSEGVDRTGRESLASTQRLATRNLGIAGESLIQFGSRIKRNGPIPLALEVIDTARLCTPPGKVSDPLVRLGVEHNARGEVIAYWIQRSHPGDVHQDINFERVPRFWRNGQLRMAHVFEQVVPGQTRGWPWMIAVMQTIKDLGDFVESELIAKQVEACFSVFITTSLDGPSPLDAAQGAASHTNTHAQRLQDSEPGGIHYGRIGEEPKFFDPTRPGSTFAPFVENRLRTIAGALNLPYEVLAKNFFRTTFSSGRLAMLDGRAASQLRSSLLQEKFLAPLWKRIVFESFMLGILDGVATRADYVADPASFERHKWLAPGWTHIDPEKEVKATVLGVEGDLMTIADSYSERGMDGDDQLDQRLIEKKIILNHEIELRVMRRDLEVKHKLPASEVESEETPSGNEPDESGPSEDDVRDIVEEIIDG